MAIFHSTDEEYIDMSKSIEQMLMRQAKNAGLRESEETRTKNFIDGRFVLIATNNSLDFYKRILELEDLDYSIFGVPTTNDSWKYVAHMRKNEKVLAELA